MTLTAAAFTACRSAHRNLVSKRGKPGMDNEFPALEKVVSELEAKLAQHSCKWREISFTLTQDQRKSANRMSVLWLAKARLKGLKNISNFFYL